MRLLDTAEVISVMKSELCERNEIAMSDGFGKQTSAPTVPKSVHANDLSLEIIMCTSGGQGSAQLSRLLDLLPSLCENAV